MDLPSRVQKAIDDAIDELNAQRPKEKVRKSPQAILFGAGGALDSLGLINLIILAEKHLEQALQVPITLADEKALSQMNSPFRTVGTLVDYVCAIAAEPSHA